MFTLEVKSVSKVQKNCSQTQFVQVSSEIEANGWLEAISIYNHITEVILSPVM